MPVGLMLFLREETRAEHLSVESAFEARAQNLSATSYLDLLKRFHRVVAAIEASSWNATAIKDLGLRPDAFYREPALLRDIQFMGGEAVCAVPYELESVAEAVGALYVLIGSMLGGQLIARNARARIGLGEEGIEFFAFQGKATSRLWKQFGEAVNRWNDQKGDDEEVLAGARKAFSAFERALSEEVAAG